MALGKRRRDQRKAWVATCDLAASPGHPFYQKLNELLADGARIEDPTDEDLRKFDRKRPDKKVSNEAWESRTDADSRIAKMKDGRTHLAYKTEHAVDLQSDLIVSASVHRADRADTETFQERVVAAQANLLLAGNLTRIVTKPEASAKYSATRFGYAKNGRTVTSVVGETWTWDGDPLSCPDDFAITFAREFRYDGARARYLDRELDPAYAQTGALVALSDLWTDYDGDEPYGDFTFDGTLTNVRSFEPGIGRAAWSSGLANAADYYHMNHLGTTRMMTDPNALQIEPSVFSAFGERTAGSVSAAEDRYGYVGGWGYQADEGFPYLHMGSRYYDPQTGRFVQRDPIGIRGGFNVYVYVENNLVSYIDVLGYGARWDKVKRKAKQIGKRIWDVVKRLPPYILPSSPIPADAAPGAACAFMYDSLRRHILKDHPENPKPDPKCPACRRLTPRKPARPAPPSPPPRMPPCC